MTRNDEDFCIHKPQGFNSHRTISSFRSILLVAMLASCGAMPALGKKSNAGAGTNEGSLAGLNKSHGGEIVFAATAIAPDAPANHPLVQGVRADGEVWARAYLTKPVGAMFDADPRPTNACRFSNRRSLRVDMKIDGGEPERIWWARDGVADETWNRPTSLPIQLDAKDSPLLKTTNVALPHGASELSTKLMLAVALLSDGTHTVDLLITASCDTIEIPIARGTIAMEVDGTARATIAQRLQLPAERQFSNPTERDRLAKLVRGHFKDGKLLHYRLLAPEWQLNRTNTEREVVAVTYFDVDGACYVGATVIREYKTLSGFAGTKFFNSDNWPRRQVPCEFKP